MLHSDPKKRGPVNEQQRLKKTAADGLTQGLAERSCRCPRPQSTTTKKEGREKKNLFFTWSLYFMAPLPVFLSFTEFSPGFVGLESVTESQSEAAIEREKAR